MVNFELICDHPNSLKHGEIIELFAEKLKKISLICLLIGCGVTIDGKSLNHCE